MFRACQSLSYSIKGYRNIGGKITGSLYLSEFSGTTAQIMKTFDIRWDWWIVARWGEERITRSRCNRKDSVFRILERGG